MSITSVGTGNQRNNRYKPLPKMQKPSTTESGFTLIEIIAVLTIAAILSAISIPAYLIQVARAKETESKITIGTLNRLQQANFTEKNEFATDVGQLGGGIRTDSTNYTFAIERVSYSAVVNLSYPKNTDTLRSHVGGVQISADIDEDEADASEATTRAVLCQSSKPGTGDPNGVTFHQRTPTCSDGFEPLLN